MRPKLGAVSFSPKPSDVIGGLVLVNLSKKHKFEASKKLGKGRPTPSWSDALATYAIFDNLPVGLFVLSVEHKTNFRILLSNNVFQEIIGLSSSQVMGIALSDRAIYSKFKPVLPRLRECVLLGTPLSLDWVLDNAGKTQYFSCHVAPLIDPSGVVSQLMVTVTDRTAQKFAEKQMLHNSTHDGLTSLPNRVLFTDQVEESIVRRRRDKNHEMAVLFINVDRFKVINDSLGHLAGDEFLVAVAKRLKACVRGRDILARVTGDEFAILLDRVTDEGDTYRIANRIHEIMRDPFKTAHDEIYTTVSIGVAISNGPVSQSDDIMRQANMAMHEAKLSGKARTQIYHREFDHNTTETLKLENDLRRALEREEFVLFYQPIIQSWANEVVGFEALIRWRHPTRGLVAPAQFIPLAEETGLIVPISRWALHTACRQIRDWRQEFARTPPLSVSVNISGSQFSNQDLVGDIQQIFEELDLDGSSLKLELTESVLMDNPELAAGVLEKLRAMNIKVAVDDFGTGYSSLSYLNKFPIDIIKIDRSFVSGLDKNEENFKIVRIITMLAETLGLDIIAEGVESQAELDRLITLKCGYWQGYYFSPPRDSETARKFLL